MFELYEDNAGGLSMFALDSYSGTVYWGQHYPADDAETPHRAAVDWAAWVLYDEDPSSYGCEMRDPGAERDATIDRGEKLIASTQWCGLLVFGFDWHICGAAGLECAEELGIIERCPECGEIVARHYIPSAGALKTPCACPTCDACLC